MPPAPSPTPAPQHAPAAESIASAVPIEAAPSVTATPDAGSNAATAYEAKTRVIVQALTQILIESGVMNRDEFHTRVRDLQLAGPEDD